MIVHISTILRIVETVTRNIRIRVRRRPTIQCVCCTFPLQVHTCHVQQIVTDRSLEENRQIKSFPGKVVGQTKNQIRIGITYNRTVIGIYLTIIIHIFEFRITRFGIGLWSICLSFLQYTDIFPSIQRAQRLSFTYNSISIFRYSSHRF